MIRSTLRRFGDETLSIQPPSDIVLDVARAADPVKSLAAAQRLARIGDVGSGADDFTSLLARTPAAGGDAQSDVRSDLGRLGVKSAGTLPQVDARTKAYKGLEQIVLQGLVENMLPKDAAEVFGGGAAGDIWRSMLAEQLAAQIGKTVDLGLARSAAAPGAMGRALAQS